MKPALRTTIVVWCAFIAVPYLVQVARSLAGLGPAGMPAFSLAGVLALVCGAAAYFQRRWTRWVLVASAALSILTALVVTLGTGMGIVGLGMLFGRGGPSLGGIEAFGAKLIVIGIWFNALMFFALAFLSGRAADRGGALAVAPRTLRADRSIAIGVVLAFAFALFGAPVTDAIADLLGAEQAGLTLTRLERLRIRLSADRSARLSAEGRQAIDELNADLALVTAGARPAHAAGPVVYGESTWYEAPRYHFIVYAGPRGIRQVTVSFNDSELFRVVENRTFLVR